MAEWSNAAVLKTVEGHTSGGSNPSFSAKSPVIVMMTGLYFFCIVIKVVVSSILPAIEYLWRPGLEPAPKIISINTALKTYTQENNFIYLDYFSAMADDKGGLKVPDYTTANDLVHPNLAGYLVMEKLAEKAIKKAFQ